jgi:hypothetical protein
VPLKLFDPVVANELVLAFILEVNVLIEELKLPNDAVNELIDDVKAKDPVLVLRDDVYEFILAVNELIDELKLVNDAVRALIDEVKATDPVHPFIDEV